ncbi:sialate O-acetylesterase [Lewinella sp. IMCC34183]|uniref:sialate O-acetylesterase n=1 Tax=Lewinella sp. IMCC34183 TaxID=2248762 RepID=UPI000E2403EE|nr:sialate O-acetylesterase [Lewinella sp. IMCC34183]
MRLLTLLFLCLLCTCLPAQDLSVFEGFTDHAVLQRNMDHPIWGWDRRNRKITLRLDEQTLTTRTDRDGRWEAVLPPTPAGGPHTITISDGRSEITLTDLYFGDVYLLSGQSNMEWRLAQSDPDSVRARAIADPLIRQLLVAKTSESSPAAHLPVAEDWKPGTADELADFSGVGAYFAHYLREGGVAVPIGLLHSSWGGSRIEPWLPAEAVGSEANADAARRRAEDERAGAAVMEFYRAAFGDTDPPREDRGTEQGWLADATDLTGWSPMELPGLWESKGYTNIDGVFYFRRTFELTPQQAAGAATLSLGPIDDSDLTYLNGHEIGATENAYSEPRSYRIRAGVLRAGTNHLAIRVTDTGGGGGLFGSPDDLYLETATGDRLPLSGTYRYRIGAFRPGTQGANQVPTLLYNAMIHPLEAWPLTGVLWYQGESNTGPADAPRYADQMRTLVGAWREQFAAPDLPFYWVQLANYMDAPTKPDAPGWALLREQQTEALDVPHTGQAVIIDIGEAGDIHPKNKWEVGRRLSLHALRDIYGRDVQASSPVADRLETHGRYATVHFRETGGGLTLNQDTEERYPLVKSLAVQDDSGTWHWAVGTLDPSGTAVTILNPAEREIRTVRYAWSDNPEDANLFSAEGLPVTPFELTAGKKR